MLQINKTAKASKAPTISAFIRALSELRKLDPEMPMQAATVFMLVAEQPGMLQADLTLRAGISQGSVSRNVHALGKRHRKGKLGLGLIVQHSDDEDIRRIRLYLTDRGRALVGRLMACIGGETEGVPMDPAVNSACVDPMRFELSF